MCDSQVRFAVATNEIGITCNTIMAFEYNKRSRS